MGLPADRRDGDLAALADWRVRHPLAIGPDGITLRLLVKTLAGRQFILHRALPAQIVECLADRDIEPATHQLTVRMRAHSDGRTRA